MRRARRGGRSFLLILGRVPSMKQRTGPLALLATLCTILIGCAGPRVNLWPVYFQETRKSDTYPGKQLTSIEILYPFVGIAVEGDRHYHVVRPFYNYESNRAEGSHRLQYLWPLGLQSAKEGDHWLHRFWPLFQHSEIVRHGGGQKVAHGMVFPLVFWGSRPPEGPYFALFPVGGVTHGLLGDTFSFVAFPLYSYYRYRDYVRHNILWPFFTIGGTPDGRQKVLRVWPLYVHNRNSGVYDDHYLLWPFVRWGTREWSETSGRYTRRAFGVFPFYSTETIRDGDGKVVARQRQVFLFTTKSDTRERDKTKGWSALWSLIRYEGSPTKRDFRIFPLYSYTAQYGPGGPESERRFTRHRILWVLVWVENNSLREDRKDATFVIAPIYWHYTQHYTAGEYAGSTGRSITLWPLATFKKDPDRSSHFWIASYGWTDRAEGYKRNYRAFFDFFQYHRRPDGEREVRILWRLFHRKSGPHGTYLSVPVLIDYDSIGDEGAGGEKSCSLLLGLVKYCWSEKGSRWRLLYIPL